MVSNRHIQTSYEQCLYMYTRIFDVHRFFVSKSPTANKGQLYVAGAGAVHCMGLFEPVQIHK